jgi:RHS repeat-associated protein
LNRQTQVTYHDNSTTDYTYDAGDRLSEIDDSISGVVGRDYDLLNRLIEETTPEGTVTYSYDGANRRATMTVAGQTQISYGYDNADRLTSITQGSGSVGFAYDSADRRTVLTLPNGVTIESSHDAASQVTGLTYKLGATTLGDLTYTYDLAGNRTAVGGSWARTNLPTALNAATYSATNQIATRSGTSFTYDQNGNITNDGFTTYSWNSRNQLETLSGSASASFQYDGLERRRSRTISGTTKQFLYDGFNAIQELASGSPSANILSGLKIDEWLVRNDNSGQYSYLGALLNSTVALANSSGVVQTEYTYEPFGTSTLSGATTSNSVEFAGRDNDGTGLAYNRARYYSPTTGRFLSEDPIGWKGGQNFYVYGNNNPLSFSDPFGLAPCNCDGPPDPQKYYSCIMYSAGGAGGIAAAACLAVGATTGFVTGFACGFSVSWYYRMQCLDCAKPCPNSKDCLTNSPDLQPNTPQTGRPPNWTRPLPPRVK